MKKKDFDIFDISDELDDLEDFSSLDNALNLPMTSEEIDDFSEDDLDDEETEDDLDDLDDEESEDNLDDEELENDFVIENFIEDDSIDDLDSEDFNLDKTFSEMFEGSGILDDDLDDSDLLDDIEYGSSPEEIKSNSEALSLDVDSFMFDINKKLDESLLKAISTMNLELLRLKGQSKNYQYYDRYDILNILESGKLINKITGEEEELTESKRTTVSQFGDKIIKDLEGRLRDIDKLYISVEQGVRTSFKHKEVRQRYKNAELPDKEAAMALNDFLRSFAVGNYMTIESAPTVNIPIKFEELNNIVIYEQFLKIGNYNQDWALHKTKLLINFYRQSLRLSEEDYKKMTFDEMFIERRFEQAILESHYNLIRNNIIMDYNMKQREKDEVENLLAGTLKRIIPAESEFYNSNPELFASLANNDYKYYSEIILNKFAYVDSINFSISGNTYVCGNCGEENQQENHFAKFIYLRTNHNETTANEPILGMNTCNKCGKINTLSGVQLNMLKRLHNLRDKSDRKIREIFQSFSKDSFCQFVPSMDIFEAILPNSFRCIESSADSDDGLITVGEILHEAGSLESASNISPIHPDYIKALMEFRRLVGMYRKADKKSIPIADRLNSCTDSYIPISKNNKSSSNTSANPTSPVTVNLLPNIDNMDSIIKVICTLTGHDYIVEKRNAVFSLIYFFNNSPLYHVFDLNILNERRIAFETRDNLKQYYERVKNKTEDIDDFYYILKTRANIFELDENLPVEELYNAYMNVNESWIKQKEKETNDNIDSALDTIFKNANLLSYVPISNIETLFQSNIFPYIHDKRIWEMIDYISNVMLITQLSEKLFTERVLPITSARAAVSRIKEQKSSAHTTLDTALMSLLNFDDVDNKAVEKFKSDCYGVMSASRDMYIDDIYAVGKIATAVINKDIFGLYNAIALVTNVRISPVKETKELIRLTEKYIPQATQFVKDFGSEDYDKIDYYLNILFTEEELKNSDIDYDVLLKFPMPPNRKENESFVEYQNRCKSDEDIIDLYASSNPIFDELDKHIIYLIGLRSYSTFLFNNVDNVELFLACSEFLRLASRKETPYWTQLILVTDKYVNGIVNSIEDFDINKLIGYDELILSRRIFLMNAFYPTYDLNKNVTSINKDWKVVPDYSDISTPVDIYKAQIDKLDEMMSSEENITVSPAFKEIVEDVRN